MDFMTSVVRHRGGRLVVAWVVEQSSNVWQRSCYVFVAALYVLMWREDFRLQASVGVWCTLNQRQYPLINCLWCGGVSTLDL